MTSLPNTRNAVTRNRIPILFILSVCAVMVLQPAWEHIKDSRTYRDITYQTPFRDVEILHFSATDIEVRLSGTMRKTRPCQTVDAPVASVVKDGRVRYAEFRSMEPDRIPQSRASDSLPQNFGPWVIRSPVPWPDRARMERTHNCGGKIQTNVVFDIPWPNLTTFSAGP